MTVESWVDIGILYQHNPMNKTIVVIQVGWEGTTKETETYVESEGALKCNDANNVGRSIAT